ncbi:MAG: ABC transporter ATP-binding protein [Spirochaetaceae bacterium]|jgi:ABC-type nitrate/sulfonate/bicarbonate transport system ATPase subunit|nr:ABC transporter ATP-binding protein [Spirochaetaceae bacterium]
MSIDIRDVCFSYETDLILKDINLTLVDGEFTSIIGPSGCGKSTLLRLLAGLLVPDAGSLTVDGAPITGPGLDRAVVFQDYSLFAWMSCRDNVVIALEQARVGANRKERIAVAEQYLELVGLRDSILKLPGELSGGMRQRAAIARALAQNAPTFLMDEPFGALDEITRARQQDSLLELWQENRAAIHGGKTILFVTHDVEEALILSDRIILFSSHPGAIAREFAVDLPRPRSHHTAIQHPRFSVLREEILQELDRVVNAQLEQHSCIIDEGGI